jgi:hypothetical protein
MHRLRSYLHLYLLEESNYYKKHQGVTTLTLNATIIIIINTAALPP